MESLYSSIHQEIGLEAIKYYLKTRGRFFEEHNKFVTDPLLFILSHNYFLFVGKFYHQLRGTAMGNLCAPTYVNLLLSWWEDTVVFGDEVHEWCPQILFLGRYIDDVLLFWSGTKEEFTSFMTFLYFNSVGLKFTSDFKTTP